MTIKKGTARKRTSTKATRAATEKANADQIHQDIFGRVKALPSPTLDPEQIEGAVIAGSQEYKDNCDRGAWDRYGYPSFDDYMRMACCSVWTQGELKHSAEGQALAGELELLHESIRSGYGDLIATRAVIRLREIYQRLAQTINARPVEA